MRGVETLLLQGIPLHPDATHDKRLPQPDTFLHMKVAQFSPHSCSSAPVWMCIGVPLAPCVYSVWGDGACCKGKRCRYSCVCVKTWRLMPPVIKSIYQSTAAYYRVVTKELGLLSDLHANVNEHEWTCMVFLFQVKTNGYVLFWAKERNKAKHKTLSQVSTLIHAHTHTSLKPCQPAECRIWISLQHQLVSIAYYKEGCVCESDEPSLGHLTGPGFEASEPSCDGEIEGFKRDCSDQLLASRFSRNHRVME